ncbi:hypothetical protein CONPUDRAFT_168076 [Coniophora puteana RWD-64-598 SS2]|uniref:ARM repeat-containing protein n=1 Tax=Coniophora puteana (strain RWD-64-598) TaxID=741705 RepID=A0A5M3MDU2_CONPW|nr:uncharacterized protein CONPUDRAFT_168076 [Coniophora puteana RWD-64-598 SS2]EIW77050.1 hypothetical protein CONPUDRAFT_168076 [Coniophora puteana RWD-64-598 SS2]
MNSISKFHHRTPPSITADNAEQTLRAPEPVLSDNLIKVFERLVDPHEDHIFVHKYVDAIRCAFRQNIDDQVTSFPPFTHSCLNAGLVKTMLAVLRQEWPTSNTPKERYTAQYHASQILSYVLETGSASERKREMETMMRTDVMEICFRDLQHPLSSLRLVAINLISSLATETCLAEQVSASLAADIMEAVCKYTLQGPDHLTNQLLDPATAWQTPVFAERGYTFLVQQPAKWGPRLFATGRESAIWSAQNILCSSPPRSRQFALDILKKRPQVIDLLLDVAIMDRPLYCPETQVDVTACEALALLFQWPLHIVPGVVTPMDKTFKTGEWKAISQALIILTSRPAWSEKLIDVWMRIQDENMEKTLSDLVNAQRDYYATQGPQNIYQYRGKNRITVLRLITTLTHAADVCGITNAQIESFLHVAYQGCRKVKRPEECFYPQESYLAIENNVDNNRFPVWTALPGVTVTAETSSMAPENIIGPTALIRLLVVLAQRKALDGIQTLRKPPNGLSPTTSLVHVQQITNPSVIRRLIKISQARLHARMDTGRNDVASKKTGWDWHMACAAFTTAAELAAALIALDTHTGGVYARQIRGARKQLVIALGNASQMALNLGRYNQALHFAWGAVTAAENIAPEEGLDPEIVEKNKRRVDYAKDGLQRES